MTSDPSSGNTLNLGPIRPVAKAVVATVVAFLGALGTALADQAGVSAVEWVGIAMTTVVTGGAVFGTSNEV